MVLELAHLQFCLGLDDMRGVYIDLGDPSSTLHMAVFFHKWSRNYLIHALELSALVGENEHAGRKTRLGR